MIRELPKPGFQILSSVPLIVNVSVAGSSTVSGISTRKLVFVPESLAVPT